MKIKEANGENVIKSWDYATEKNKRTGSSTASLTVTNKRIIAVKSGKISLEREEIAIDDVIGVSVGIDRPKISWWNVFCGVVWFIAIIGIVILVKEYLRLKQGAFALVLHTREEGGSGLELYVNSIKPKKNSRRKNNKIKIALDRACAYEIAEEVGAMIIENRK